VLNEGELDLQEGLVGDNWSTRGSSPTADGSSHPDMQLNIMNSRVIALVAQDKERWQLTGDQLFIELDLSAENLPPGSRLAMGTGVYRSHSGTPRRLSEVCGALWWGCDEFCKFRGGEAASFARDKC